MEHTQECEQVRERREAEIDLWEANWPNYCKNCDAWGGFASTENGAPMGGGEFWPMNTWDDCEECIGQGKCPRCGHSLFPDDDVAFDKWMDSEEPCPFCGWKRGMYVGDIKPDDFECWCWLPDSDDEYKEEMAR